VSAGIDLGDGVASDVDGDVRRERFSFGPPDPRRRGFESRRTRRIQKAVKKSDSLVS
jgi:hypothetical protein